MDRVAWIEERLRQELGADPVEVIDESHRHAGHAGAREGGGHFRALVVCGRFAGLGPVERQRLVYGALSGEMGAGIHALSMQTLTPQEWSERRAAGPARPAGPARQAR